MIRLRMVKRGAGHVRLSLRGATGSVAAAAGRVGQLIEVVLDRAVIPSRHTVLRHRLLGAIPRLLSRLVEALLRFAGLHLPLLLPRGDHAPLAVATVLLGGALRLSRLLSLSAQR